MIAKLCDTPHKWDQVIKQAEFALNNTICRATNDTPSRLLFGIEQAGEVNNCIRLMLNVDDKNHRNLESLREKASQIIGKTQRGNETRYNSKRKEATVYKEGDYVMIGNTDTTAGVNKKLISKFRGPYQIKKVLERDHYIVGDIDGFQVTQRPYNSIVASDNMKPYVEV
ncbi:hypothetical protein ANTQUA_LOCUS2235 [Anthophora quadrimaculata]